MPYKDLEKRKQCSKESNARYYLKTLKPQRQTPEGKIKHCETVKRFYQKHPEKAIQSKDKRERQRIWEKKYREKKRYLQSNHTEQQKENYRKSWRKYQLKPEVKEQRSKQAKKRYLKNREKRLEYGKRYHRENPEINLRNGQKYLEKLGIDLGILTKDVKRVLMNWKRTVQKRDKVCQICGTDKNLNAHHILHRKYYPKLALNTNNGIILCNIHHNESHGWCLS